MSQGGNAGTAQGGSGGSLDCTETPPRACDDRALKADKQGLCDEGGWCWENPVPYGQTFAAVHAVAANDVWAVASSDVLHYDGSAWRLSLKLQESGRGIWSDGASVWASSDSALYRFDGTTWNRQLVPGGVGRLSVLSPSNAWAARQGRVTHFDGATWTSVSSPVTRDVFSTVAISATEVWVGSIIGEVYRYKDGSWTSFGSTNGWPVSILAFAPDNIWISAPGSEIGQVRRYTGGSTLEVAPIPDGNDIARMWGTSPDHVVAFSNSRGLVEWDGATLRDMPDGVPGYVWDLSGTQTNDIWAVGEAGTLSHYDGTAWSPHDTFAFVAPGSYRTFRSMHGTAADDVWAVGSELLAHFDGTRWEESSSSLPGSQFVSGVWAEAADSVYITVGHDVLHYDGSTWSVVATSDLTLGNVVGLAPGELWIAANSGSTYAAIHYVDGALTTYRTDAQSGSISAVWASSNCNVWFGSSEWLYRFDGREWHQVALPSNAGVSQIWGTSPTDVWVATYQSMYHFDGTALTKVRSLPGGPVWGCGTSDVWTQNTSGGLWHHDGADWTQLGAGSDVSIFGTAWSAGSGAFISVGRGGAVKRLTPE